MSLKDIHPELLAKCEAIRGKRSRVVVEHIIKHGSITTEDLERYGYKHPPRAIRDVREQGLPLDQSWTTNSQGRRIAEYRFGDPRAIRGDRVGGRLTFAREFVDQVLDANTLRCAVCHAALERRYLQIDHRIPYDIAGDSPTRRIEDFMPLCGSCNRAKSWSCEHCENRMAAKDPKVCMSCYWAQPSGHSHVAMHPVRRVDLVWQGDEVREYESAYGASQKSRVSLPEFLKSLIRRDVK